MAQELINIGVSANDGSGDPINVAGQKINNNFEEIFAFPRVQSHIGTKNNNIVSQLSNEDIVLKPSGTGSIVFPNIRINDNNIETIQTNSDLKIIPSGSGSVVINGLGFAGTTITATDSSIVNINENVIVDGTLSASGAFTFPLAMALGSTLSTGGLATLSSLTITGATTMGNLNIENLSFIDGTISTTSNADLHLTPGGTGSVIIDNLTIDSNINLTDNKIQATATNSELVLSASGTGDIVAGGIRIHGTTLTSDDSSRIEINEALTINSSMSIAGNEIKPTTTNSELVLSASGTGDIVAGGIRIHGTTLTSDDSSRIKINEAVTIESSISIADNKIQLLQSNAELVLSASGTGDVVLSAIRIHGTTLTSDDSSEIAINEGLTVDSNISISENQIQTTASNSDLLLLTAGTGAVKITKADIDGGTVDDVVIGGEVPAAGTFSTITLSPTDTASLSSSGVKITDNTITSTQSNDDLEFLGNGTGTVRVNQFYLPNADGNIGQLIRTDGSKVLDWFTSPILFSTSNLQDVQGTISFSSEVTVDHVTATGAHELIQSSASVINSFAVAKYDSAWYVVLTRDDDAANFEIAKYSVVHDNTNAFITTSNLVKSDTNNYITATAGISGGFVRVSGAGAGTDMNLQFYRIGLGDDDSTGYVSEDATNAVAKINTDIDSAIETLDSWAKADFRGAKYFISVNDGAKTELGNIECLVVHDGTNAFVNTYNIVNTGNNDLLTITADIDSNNVRLRASGNTPNLRVHMYRILLADDESSSTGTNVNVVGATTVSTISQTTIDTNSFRGTAKPDFSSTKTASTFATTDFDSVWYHLINRDQTNGEFNMEKLSVMHGTTTDGSTQDAFITSSSVVKSGVHNDVMSHDVDIDGSNVRLRTTGVSDGSTTISNSMTYYALGLGSNTADATSGNIGTEAGIILGGNNETQIDHVIAEGTTQGSLAEARTGAEFTASQFNGALYHIVTKDVANGSFETQKVSVLHNFNNAFITSSAVTRSDVGDTHPTFDADMVTADDSASKIRLRMTDGDGSSVTPSNTMAYYRIGIGTDDSTGYIGELGLVHDIMHVDIIGSSVVNLDAFTKAPHAAAKYFINVRNQSTGETSNIEALVTHDNTNAYITSYNEHFSGNNSLITLTADISGTSVRLRGSATSGASTKVIVNRIVAFADTESDEATTDSTRKVIGNVTASSSATTFDTFQSSDTDAVHYVVCGQNGANEKFICEATVVTDGTGVFIAQGPNVSTKGTDMLELTATISAGTVSVKASSTSGASTAVSAYAVRLKAPATSAKTMDSWAHASYRGAKYYISAEDTDNGNVSNIEALVVHNGSEAFITVSNEHFSNTRLVTLTATLSGSTVSIDATPQSGDIRIKFYRIRLADNESDATGTDANTIGAVTVASAATDIDTFEDTQHTGAHYVMVANNSTEGAASISEFTVVTDGVDASVAQGPEVSTKGTGQIFLTAAHNGSSTVTISASSTSGGSTTVNAYRIHMLRPEATSTTTIDSFVSGTYNGAYYVVVAKKVGAADSQISEIQAVTNGSDTFINSDPIVSSTGSSLVNYTAGNTGSTAEIRALAADGTSSFTVNAYRINLARGAGSASSQQVLDSFSVSSFRGAKYTVQASDSVGGNFEIFDVTVMHDGTTAFISEGARIGNSTPSDLFTLTADIDSGNVRLLGAISNTNDHVITAVKRLINV